MAAWQAVRWSGRPLARRVARGDDMVARCLAGVLLLLMLPYALARPPDVRRFIRDVDLCRYFLVEIGHEHVSGDNRRWVDGATKYCLRAQQQKTRLLIKYRHVPKMMALLTAGDEQIMPD